MVLSPNRHDKVVDSVRLASDHQLCDHHGVVGGSPQRSWPPGHRRQPFKNSKSGSHLKKKIAFEKKGCKQEELKPS